MPDIIWYATAATVWSVAMVSIWNSGQSRVRAGVATMGDDAERDPNYCYTHKEIETPTPPPPAPEEK